MTKKILIVNPFGIGDVIFSTPLVEVLKKYFPDSCIAYICNRRALRLIETNPGLNKIFVYEKDEYRDALKRSKIDGLKKILAFLKEIRREKFDISIDLSLGYKHSMILKLIGIKKRVGFNYRNRGRFLTDKLDIESFDNKHVIDHYLGLVKLLGIDIKSKFEPRIFASKISQDAGSKFLKDACLSEGDLLIGMLPGCGASWGADAKRRRWSIEKFARLADLLIEKHGAKIILLGDAKEVDIASGVQNLMKNKVVNYCGKTSLGDLIGIMTKCRLIITNEGGPLHMAVALGVKTVSLFGPVDEKTYGPYSSSGDHAVVSRKDLKCRPCYKKFKYNDCKDRTCLASISVEEVLGAAEGLLKR